MNPPSLSRRLVPAVLVASVVLAGGTTAAAAAAERSGPAGAVAAVAAPAVEQDRRDSRAVPRIVQEWADAWNAADGAAMAALFTEDGVYEDLAFEQAFTGPAGVTEWVDLTRQVIPDARIEVVDAFRTGNRVAVRFVFSGTPVAEYAPGRELTGKSFSVEGASLFELERGELSRVSDFYNRAALESQIGLTPGA